MVKRRKQRRSKAPGRKEFCANRTGLAPIIKTGNPFFFKCGVRLGLNQFS